jgi:hypothetical protein
MACGKKQKHSQKEEKRKENKKQQLRNHTAEEDYGME